MTFYQELQLGSYGSKALIRGTEDKKEKWRHILIYNFKVYLVVAFCFSFVTIAGQLLGSGNSIVGVVVLLALLVLRQADFGIKTTHGVGVIGLIFAIWAVGPRLTNMVSNGAAFVINMVCIMIILILSCHNVLMYNQSTFVLGYLLLQGYDVEGHAYVMRLIGLVLGMGICMGAFYKNQKNRVHKRKFADLFREINLRAARTQWYIRLTFGVSSAMLLASCMNIPRVMWVGISCMSVLLPFTSDLKYRVHRRAVFNVVGCMILAVLYVILPAQLFGLAGVLGGIGVGFSAGYAWQTVFNTFGAVAVASGLFGMKTAILLRIVTNLFGSLYAWTVDFICRRVRKWISGWNNEEEILRF